MPGFGIDSDYFGLADTNLVLQSASKVPKGASDATATDSQGDPAAKSYYGTKGSSGDTAYDITCQYALKASTLKLSTLSCGAKGSAVVLRGLTVSTSNGEWPTIEATGRNAVSAADTANIGTWALPPITISGRKKAQALGFTVDTGTRLTGSSLELSLDEASTMDSTGEEAAYDISGGVCGVTADIVSVTAAPGWTMDTLIGDTSDSYTGTFTETQKPGDEESNTDYATGSGAAELIITRT